MCTNDTSVRAEAARRDVLARMGEDAPLVDLKDLGEWLVCDDEDVLVVNKPGWLVCHPSKNGPLSSLVGAIRERTGMNKIHLVARLDRETSGLVIFARRPAVARRLQMAIQKRSVVKRYLAILEGELTEPVTVDQALGRDADSAVYIKQCVKDTRSAQAAVTEFVPLAQGGGYTLCEVRPESGRKHQIRAHALWLGYPLLGDKIYGRDEQFYLEFIEQGWTARLEADLHFPRQALHCGAMTFTTADGVCDYRAPLAADMATFAANTMGLALTPEGEPVVER